MSLILDSNIDTLISELEANEKAHTDTSVSASAAFCIHYNSWSVHEALEQTQSY